MSAQVGKHAQYAALLTAQAAHAIGHLSSPRAQVFTILDNIGVQEIAEQIALGRLPNEVALAYDVPVLHFRAWLRERVTEEHMELVRAAAAESLQVKSVLVLSAELKSPAEASQAKALSERFAKQAESLDPRAWSAAHMAPERAMPTINIVFGTPDGGQAVTINTAPLQSERPETIDNRHELVVSPQEVDARNLGAPPVLSCARNHDTDSPQGENTLRGLLTPDVTSPVPHRPRKAGFDAG